MSALFPQWTNTLARLSLLGVAGGLATLVALPMLWVRSPLFSGRHQPVTQPLEFDHRHHVSDDGIDCRYCHDGVDRSSSAGYPATSLCMNCHSQVWNKSPMLDPIRASFFTNRPIPWRRVNRLPDFVYFNHSIHIAKGVGCVTCHGRVDQMPAVAQAAPLTMSWCIDCHRSPEARLRPREHITDMTWTTPDPVATGRALARQYQVHTRVSCTACHR